MASSAPRTPWPLVAAIEGLDSRDVPIAEVWRRSCGLADLIGVSRPSYEQIRRLVHRRRRLHEGPGDLGLLVDFLSLAHSTVGVPDELIERSLVRETVRATIVRERSWRPTA